MSKDPDTDDTERYFLPGGGAEKSIREVEKRAAAAGVSNVYQNCGEEAAMERMLARSVEVQQQNVITLHDDEYNFEAPGISDDAFAEPAPAPIELEGAKATASPEKKRTKSERVEEFQDRTFNHLSEFLVDGTPATQEAAYSLMEKMGESGDNMAKNIVKSKTVKGTPEEGESPKMADRLIKTEKLVLKRVSK